MGAPRLCDEQKEEAPHFVSVGTSDPTLGLYLINEVLVLAWQQTSGTRGGKKPMSRPAARQPDAPTAGSLGAPSTLPSCLSCSN